MLEREKLISYAIKYHGDYQHVRKAIANNENIEIINYEGQCVTILDDEYPKEFLSLSSPPIVLFCEGDIRLLKQRKISIVGSRNYDEYGKNVTIRISNTLKDHFVLVSGMAKGIDSFVHQSCIDDSATIGVLGCGIKYVYPLENSDLYQKMRNKQLLISEYPGYVRPYKHHFPFRNRLIAALGEILIVTQASKNSGTFLTVNEALSLQKDIYVVPYRFEDTHSGSNYLILEGANILCDQNDLEKLKESLTNFDFIV